MSKNARQIIFTADAKLSLKKFAADGADKIATLTGYALLWNVLSSDRGGYKVRLMPGSAKFTTPTFAFWHHDASRVLASTANGTLRIMPDDVGVKVEIDLPDTSDGRDAEELVEKRYVTGMSFAMVNAPNGDTVTEDGVTILNARSYMVDEVTITAVPAFPQTSIEVDEDDEPEPVTHAARTDHALKFEKLRFDFLQLPAGV